MCAEPARTTLPLSGADFADSIDHAHEPHRMRAGSLLPEAVMATTARVADNALLGICHRARALRCVQYMLFALESPLPSLHKSAGEQLFRLFRLGARRSLRDRFWRDAESVTGPLSGRW